ncbi:MAG: DNA replication/repair protein RecF [Cyanobacteria bacterium SIG30]|nr:DNA replication/repair protein RecF [Cyanobacteria bacterium SIG30]
MKIKSIELTNFRNYSNLFFEFKEDKTLVIGKNAQGKTNFLEALYYLSSLNSKRISRDSELISFNEDLAKLKAVIVKDDYEQELEVIINPPKKKILKVNGLKKNKSSEFLRVLSIVNFCVDDLLLLRGDPSNRRHWLDEAICQIFPIYSDKLSKYNKIRLQKSNYLAQFAVVDDMLDVFNSQLATSGANIIYLRKKFLKEIAKVAVIKHENIAKGEVLKLMYETSVGDMNDDMSPGEIEEVFKQSLNDIRQDEIRRAQCLIGPHRDDVSYFINDIDSKKFASQGQQRTIVLALKLAELEIIKEKNNDIPILLLDDVLAELDNVRQNFLLDAVEDKIQTVITSVDTLAFDKKFLENVDIINIKNGEIINE